MDHSLQLRDKSISRLLWTFSVPAIVGMLVNSLYNIIDRIFVGRGIGSLGIAATAVAFPIMVVLMAVSILVGVGATALISIRLGEQRKDEAEKIAGNALTMLVLLPILAAGVFFMFPEQILIAWQQPGGAPLCNGFYSDNNAGCGFPGPSAWGPTTSSAPRATPE